jgi:hypothetical protein
MIGGHHALEAVALGQLAVLKKLAGVKLLEGSGESDLCQGRFLSATLPVYTAVRYTDAILFARGKGLAVRRDLMLASGMAGLFCALLLAAAWGLLVVPPLPRDLLPPDATVAQVRPQGLGRSLVLAQLGPRQGRHDLYAHLTAQGWRLRRVNVLPDDADQIYFRRSMGGYVLEVAIVAPAGQGRGLVAVAYSRCVRHISCSWR